MHVKWNQIEEAFKTGQFGDGGQAKETNSLCWISRLEPQRFCARCSNSHPLLQLYFQCPITTTTQSNIYSVNSVINSGIDHRQYSRLRSSVPGVRKQPDVVGTVSVEETVDGILIGGCPQRMEAGLPRQVGSGETWIGADQMEAHLYLREDKPGSMTCSQTQGCFFPNTILDQRLTVGGSGQTAEIEDWSSPIELGPARQQPSCCYLWEEDVLFFNPNLFLLLWLHTGAHRNSKYNTTECLLIELLSLTPTIGDEWQTVECDPATFLF